MALSVTGDATAGKARVTSVFVSKEILSETEANIDDVTTTDSIPDADINDSTISGKDEGNIIVMEQTDGEFGIAIAKGPGLSDGWSKLRPIAGDAGTLITAADLADATAAVNTTGKYLGKLVKAVGGTSLATMYIAQGALATSAWHLLTDSATGAVTPS